MIPYPDMRTTMTHKTNTPSEQQHSVAGTFLSENVPGRPKDVQSRIRMLRRTAFRAVLNEYGTCRFTELRPDAAQAVLDAFNLKQVGQVRNGMIWDEEQVANHNERIPSVGSTPKDRLEAKRREMLMKRLEQEQAELKADFDGRAWTVQAAYKPHMVFLFIKQGIHKSDDDIETLRSQHVDAHMYLEPTVLIGNLGEVRAEATRQFTGQGDGDVLVRIIKKEST